MKEFSNIDEFLDFCKKNKKTCQQDRKKMADTAAMIYLTKAGYTNFDNVDLSEIYKELVDISRKSGIGGQNPLYLSAKNEDIMNGVIMFGSDKLKQFLRKNGYHIVEVIRHKTVKDLREEMKKKQDIETILLKSPRFTRSRAGTNEITRNRSNSRTVPLSPLTGVMYLNIPGNSENISRSSVASKNTIIPNENRSRSSSVASKSTLNFSD